MPIKEVLSGNAPVKIWTDDVDDLARAQLRNVASLPFIYKHVAAMPDVHVGMGATIGSVIATSGAIIPAAVGVDLGCGMCAVRTDIEANWLPDNLHDLRCVIEATVPHGRTHNGGLPDKGAWDEIPDDVRRMYALLPVEKQEFVAKHPKLLRRSPYNAERHLGTLGTGNHFIELCLDEDDMLWLMLHSGSRGIGNRIGTYFIELAREDMRKWYINLPDIDLAYFPEGTEHFGDYMKAVQWAQNFAHTNRLVMMHRIIALLQDWFPGQGAIELHMDCHHNYVARENHYKRNVWITRKGAIRARNGDWGIIPGSMGAQSYIVQGLGNRESFQSCSHGAGRRMSRSEARRRFTADDLRLQTEGIECPKDDARVDEIPLAYKPIDEVMQNQHDLVRVVHTLHQVLNVKG